jgi:methylsterol monooxygenase
LQTPPPNAVNPKTGSPELASAVRVVLFNQFFGTLPALVLVFQLMQWRGHAFASQVPGAWEILRDLALMVLIEEVLFYAVHYAMHQRPLFARFHHIHHRFRRSIGIATHYVHFVEHLVGNLMPIFTAVILTNAHVVTTFVWVAMAVTNAIHTHSDYNFPWMSYAADHDWHHYHARGNYGTIGLLDRVFGTDRDFRALATKAKAEKQRAA